MPRCRLKSAVQAIAKKIKKEAASAEDEKNIIELSSELSRLYRENNIGVYHDDEFEKKIYDLLVSEEDLFSEDSSWCDNLDFLHVATTFIDSGGDGVHLHTIAGLAARGCRQLVVSLAPVTASVESFLASHDIELKVLPDVSVAGQVALLRSIAKKSVYAVFNIRYDDIRGALLLRGIALLDVKTLFINHADHLFSYGAAVADVILEVSAFGWAITEKSRKFKRHSYVGIPLGMATEDAVENSGKYILTIGAGYKYGSPGHRSFAQLINLVLGENSEQFVIIGPTGEEEVWDDLDDAIRNRVAFLGRLDRRRAKNWLAHSKCYIDSFPVTGGTAFGESVFMGVPSFGLKVEACGYNPGDLCRYPTIQSLSTAVNNYISDEVAPRNHVIAFKAARDLQSREATLERFIRTCEGAGIEPPDVLARSEFDSAHFEREFYCRGEIKISKKQAKLLSRPTILNLLFSCSVFSRLRNRSRYHLLKALVVG